MNKAGARAVNLDSPFDRLTTLLCGHFDMPFGLVSVIDGEETIFRSEIGLGEDSMSRRASATNLLVAMGPGASLVIEDATEHPEMKHHPMVVGPPYVRFFAGATITTADGLAVGAVGIMDVTPHPAPSPTQIETLKLIAQIAGNMVDQVAAARVQAEQLQMLEMAEAISSVGHWRLDLVTNRVAWSDEVYRIHGVERAGFDPSLGDALSFYHPDDRGPLADGLGRAAETGEGFESRFRLIRADGQERVVVARCGAERREDGTTIALYGVFQDVTEAERVHQRIKKSEARYRLLADRATDIIVTYGTDGLLTYVSPSIEAVAGLLPRDLIGKPVTSLILSEDVPAVVERFKKLVHQATDANGDRLRYRASGRGGAVLWFETRTAIIRDADGTVIEFQDVVRDITETKKLEDQLIEARDRAEAGARAKSEFLANMSHELRTPLTSVIGFSGLLQASEHLPASERGYADRIQTASDALLSVINDILDYSKLEAQAVEMEPLAFDPRVLVDGAATIIEAQCRNKGLALSVAIDPDLPVALTGDAGRLRQVMLNFLSNAVKFTPHGGIHLTMGGQMAAEGQWRLRVSVTDTGIGMSPDQSATMFDRFTQADASTTRIYGGTGLGLAISRRLVELMGGTVGADSRPGEGSTFWLEVALPVAESVAGPAVYDASIPRTGGRILVADDAAANRELIVAILGGLGLTVDAVCDGAEAVEAARTGRYDLVLMDVQMPVMDGLAATRAIRAMEGPVARLPILALTANVQREQIDRCLAAGMDGHLGKPIQIAELAEALGRCLGAATDADPAVRAG
jgi:PAS domain S-box-containing protein